MIFIYAVYLFTFLLFAHSNELKTDINNSIWRSSLVNSGIDMRYNIYNDNQQIHLYQIKNYMRYYQYLQQLNKYQSSISSTSHKNKLEPNIHHIKLAENVVDELYYNPCSHSKYTMNLFNRLQNDFE